MRAPQVHGLGDGLQGFRFVAWPEDASLRSALGGKASALVSMSRAGLPVPPWCVLLPTAFTASTSVEDRMKLAESADSQATQALLAGVRPSARVRTELSVAVSRLCPDDEDVAVRSSAVGEDSAQSSFAGQLKSFLSVEPGHVAERVADVWRSGFTTRVLAYRKRRGYEGAPPVPAVIVQRMVQPRVSGVAFSADPVSGRRDVAVVSAVRGVGETLVSGDADADTWRVKRDGEILSQSLVTEKVGARGGESPQPVEKGALTQGELQRVVQLAQETERLFGAPQDVEWAMEGERVYLLQSRPITTLSSEPSGNRRIWDNSNISENYSGTTTPLTFSFVRTVYSLVYRRFCVLMGAPTERVRELEPHLHSMIGLIQGRMYYNLLNWYRMLSVLPGFKSNRRFLERLLGVRELPQDILDEIESDSGFRERLGDQLQFIGSALRILANLLTLDRKILRFRETLRDQLGTTPPDLSGHNLDDLVSYYRAVQKSLEGLSAVPALNDHAVMVSVGLFCNLLKRIAGEEKVALQGVLLSGGEETVSGRLARRLGELARLATQRPAIIGPLCEGNLASIMVLLDAWPELKRLYLDYLDEFGDRFMGELKLESIPLREDPLPLLRSIGRSAQELQRNAQAPGGNKAGTPDDAEEQIKRLLARRPIIRALYGRVLAGARRRLRARELLRYERARVFARVRQIMIEIGNRLVDRNRLEQRDDVFYVRIEELLDFADGCTVTTDLKALVTLRRCEFSAYDSLPAPPTRFETWGPVYLGNRKIEIDDSLESCGTRRTGLGSCPGQVRGPARVVSDPAKARVLPGDIVVARHTDPGWVLVLPMAAGLLVEREHLLSHAAIIARELGLPTVVSIPGLMDWLRDGDQVELDGELGTVTKLESGATGSSAESPDASSPGATS